MASIEDSCESSAKMYTIEASVPTGFESVAADEAKEMFQTECTALRGKITFQTPAESVKDILKLGGIDHCRAQILRIPHFGFTDDGDDCLSRLQLLVKQCDWAEGLEIWHKFFTFPHPISPRPDTVPSDEQLIDICYSKHMPGRGTAGASPGKKKNRRFKRKGKKEGEKSAQRRAASDQTHEEEEEEESVEPAQQKENNGGESPGHQDHETPEALEEGACAEPLPSEVQNGSSGNMNGNCRESMGGAEVNNRQEQQQNVESPSKKFKNHGDNGVCPEEEACGNGNPETSTVTSAELSANHDVASANGQGDSGAEPLAENGDLKSSQKKPGDNGAPAAAEGARSPGKKASRPPPDPTKPVFRVTCKRTGENHSFDSMSAASSLGSAIQTYFGWAVDMTHFNIEVMLTIDNHEVTMGLTLTPESLHKRNLVAFGVTTLRPTICHNMLRMVKIKPGHVVCDPLCGTASISIQGALSFPALQLCGDNHEVAMKKTLANHTALNKKRQAAGKGALMMDAVRWNALYLPLRDGIVDVFVSDLPFGKRVGRKFENQKLYCRVLDEMARCGKLSGRAALLTGDVNNMVKAIQAQKYWTRRRCYSCNIGGIAAAVFLLFRSNVPYTPPSQHQMTHHHHHHHHHHPPPPLSDPQASQNSPPSDETEAQSIPSTGEGGDALPLAGETLVQEG